MYAYMYIHTYTCIHVHTHTKLYSNLYNNNPTADPTPQSLYQSQPCTPQCQEEDKVPETPANQPGSEVQTPHQHRHLSPPPQCRRASPGRAVLTKFRMESRFPTFRLTSTVGQGCRLMFLLEGAHRVFMTRCYFDICACTLSFTNTHSLHIGDA